LSLENRIAAGRRWRHRHRERAAAHVELKTAGDHDDGLRAVAVLEQREFQGFLTADEKTAAAAALILDDPVAAAVLADEEEGRARAGFCRGRFRIAHDTFSFHGAWDDWQIVFLLRGGAFIRLTASMCGEPHMKSRRSEMPCYKCGIENGVE